MIKLILFLFFINISFLSEKTFSSLQDYETDDGKAISFSLIECLPSELIIEISDNLGGKDFRNFSSTCKFTHKLLMRHEAFFIPREHNLLIPILSSINIDSLEDFLFKFSRNLIKDRIREFQELSSHFENYGIHPQLTEKQGNERTENLRFYIKINRILTLLNLKEAEKKLISVKDDKLCSLFSDLKDYYVNKDKVAFYHTVLQAYIVYPKTESYLLASSRQDMARTMRIDINEIIKQEEESLKKWIPQKGYYDDQF